MIIAVDIETKGLDARKFVTGCIMKENGIKKHFYSKKKLWEYIKNLGEKESKRKRVLNVYAHNHEFDFYGYGDLEDTNLRFIAFRPFIAQLIKKEEIVEFENEHQYKEWKNVNWRKNHYVLYENADEIAIQTYTTLVNFLDSYGIFKMSLKKLGDIIGLEKLETPEEFINAERMTQKRIKELAPYIERDVEIIIKAIEMMKEKMKKEGVVLKRLYTISQIAVAYLINTLKKNDMYEDLFYRRDLGILRKSWNKEKIHEAYRGGRVECFKLGEFKEVDYLDINNLYGYSSTMIRFPNLNAERITMAPLKYFSVEKILNKIGVSRVLIHNKYDKIGLLPVRTETGNYYPKKDKYIIGTYTHLELKKALSEGYEIINIEWTLTWEEMINPFREITPRLYKLRKESKDPFDNFFYKEMQNRSYGKLAQRKSGQEIVIDSVENAKKYLKENYEIIKSYKYNYIYKKEKKESEKPYYAPIIPTLINAYARCYMYDLYKRIPEGKLIYTDTDSCVMESGHKEIFKDMIKDGLGMFKIEHEKEPFIVKGRKTYAIGNEVKVAGFRKQDVTFEDFKKGKIKSKKMRTLKSSKDIKDVGSFEEEKRNLNEQLKESREIDELYKKETIFRDKDIKDITFFTNDLIRILESKVI